MALSKKHYEAIARRIKASTETVARTETGASYTRHILTLNELACDLAFDFRQDNPQFDEARFLKACGF